ncbi:hypothetical protein AVEN_254561-1 [Araneus ventricosus]|uniref:Uncharacterized protein n=1 Tax=Araneus ventricosus TaxID=182803 RepID=A0A4Y2Q2B6_ARAVE|nr:hypothetical protein AVEN_24409-1 [Araneus ventricosus]GBN57319.1 hypothetical protein AVEN_254561-1 [Araneus ventricosus]
MVSTFSSESKTRTLSGKAHRLLSVLGQSITTALCHSNPTTTSHSDLLQSTSSVNHTPQAFPPRTYTRRIYGSAIQLELWILLRAGYSIFLTTPHQF